MVFLGTVSGLTSLYFYDRKEAKRIKQSYIDRVSHMAEVPMKTWELPRKLTVYACKWPGDDDYDRSMGYFKKYVKVCWSVVSPSCVSANVSSFKPVLAAAAIDYELNNGNQYGALARQIADQIKERRRQEAGLEAPRTDWIPGGPGGRQSVDHLQRELDGGIVIIGRHTLKEFMEGLKRGWSESIQKVDRDELLAMELAQDGKFDEPIVEGEDAGDGISQDTESSSPTSPTKPNPLIFSPFQQMQLKKPLPPAAAAPPPVPTELDTPPTQLPQLPPIALVPYTSILGFTKIPLMIADFFNERKHAQNGCEAAFKIIEGHTRPINAPPAAEFANEGNFGSAIEAPTTTSDLLFDSDREWYFRKSFQDAPSEVEKARKRYYEALPEKLKTARDLARREREPTKDEIAQPPLTEVELTAERLKKERKWRDELEGFEILKAGQPVTWDERFRNVLKIFVKPPSDTPSQFV